jgi:hypothetical protein
MASATVFVNIWRIAALQILGVFCYVTRELTVVMDVDQPQPVFNGFNFCHS